MAETILGLLIKENIKEEILESLLPESIKMERDVVDKLLSKIVQEEEKIVKETSNLVP
jgi:hypothetical protein